MERRQSFKATVSDQRRHPMKCLSVVMLAVALTAGSASLLATTHERQLVYGEVRKVDKDAKKLTIRHGPLPQLDMPTPMTMVYQVNDPALLDQVKPGDKIQFATEKQGGAYVVTRIEPAGKDRFRG